MSNERKHVTIVLAITDLFKANELTELQCTALLAGMTVASAQLAGISKETFRVLIADAWSMNEAAPPEMIERLRALAVDVNERKG